MHNRENANALNKSANLKSPRQMLVLQLFVAIQEKRYVSIQHASVS